MLFGIGNGTLQIIQFKNFYIMKYFTVIFLILITSCNGQNNQSTKNKNIMDIIVKKDSEKFDIQDLLTYGKKTPIDNQGNFDYSLTKIREKDTNYMFGQKNNYYVSIQYNEDSYYAIKKIFNGNGIIQEKGAFFNGGDYLKLGIWYQYDDTGKLLKEIDYDEGYKFSFQDVLNFCQLKKIKIVKGDVRKLPGGFYTQILKDENNGKKVWIIKYQDGIKITENVVTDGNKVVYKSVFEEIILDGQTGKVISEKTINEK